MKKWAIGIIIGALGILALAFLLVFGWLFS